MESVTGIGGIFFKGKDRDRLMEWYRDCLGVPVDSWGGTSFQWSTENQPATRPGQTVWSIFKDDSEYFGPSGQRFMLNFRVRDLEAMLSQLREKGANLDPRVEASEYGKFTWVTDPEGNRVELWEPPDSEAG